jgi:hypothetical protein
VVAALARPTPGRAQIMAMMISTNATTTAEPVLKSGAGRAQESPEEELTPGRRLRPGPYSRLWRIRHARRMR